jgi:hypothetical protein
MNAIWQNEFFNHIEEELEVELCLNENFDVFVGNILIRTIKN